VNQAAGCGIVEIVNVASPKFSEKAELPFGAVTIEDLAAWDAEFNDICARIGPLLAPLERKNGWTIAEYSGLHEPKAMQRFLNLTPWDSDRVHSRALRDTPVLAGG
jgi:hypothetical protein